MVYGCSYCNWRGTEPSIAEYAVEETEQYKADMAAFRDEQINHPCNRE
ncbi:MAG: hypothetical protein U1D67_01535 [Dehalococcoidia bacterium]|nr:hypothetical protein [Dehalococcoidia bacterium]